MGQGAVQSLAWITRVFWPFPNPVFGVPWRLVRKNNLPHLSADRLFSKRLPSCSPALAGAIAQRYRGQHSIYL